jgi:DHA3 family macrolide efflux protein-like MFS transporter
MVPVENLTRIQGLNQMLNGGLNIVAAPLGALLLELLPLQGILAIDVVTALFAIVPLLFFSIPQPDRKESTALVGEGASFWEDFRAGFRYLVSWKGLLIVALMASLINMLLSPAFTLLPLLVNGYFGKDAIEYGAMQALFGIGVIAGGVILGVWGGFKRRIITAMAGLLGIGIGTLVLGILPPEGFTWAVVGMTFIGIVQPITNGSLLGLVQAIVAPDMQGRVFTLISSLAGAMSPIGLAIAGPISDALGTQTWFIVGGLMCILMALVSFATPAVMNIEDEGREINGVGLEEQRVAEESGITS